MAGLLAEKARELDANPRFYDRCNAVCCFILTLALLSIVYLAMQPSLNPPLRYGGANTTTIESQPEKPDDTASGVIQPKGSAEG